MKRDSVIVDLFLHGIIGILGGALAFRACMSGRGYGNFPGNAILAGTATGMMAFIFSLILTDMFPDRHKQKAQLGVIALLIVIHMLNF